MKNQSCFRVLAILVPVLSALPALADELILPREVFRAMGYLPVAKPVQAGARDFQAKILAVPPHGLAWPVVFQDAAHTIAQNYVTYQNYGDGQPYYHGGCDLRTAGAANVTAPVSGVLEGGYYGYVDNPDGSMEKQWNPWNGQTHDDPYFELAIVTDDGYRYEIHHIDSLNLPSGTVDMLNQGHVRVAAGTVIGIVNAAAFPDYAHVHYNIIRPDGVRMNPEQYAVAGDPPDHTAPKILGVYGVDAQGGAEEIPAGQLVADTLTEVVVDTTESRDGDAYVQTPPYAQLRFVNGSVFTWDFRETLLGPDGKWPDLRSFIAPELSLPSGTITTEGQFGAGHFLIRLPVAATDHGDFQVTIGDTNGNQTVFSAAIK